MESYWQIMFLVNSRIDDDFKRQNSLQISWKNLLIDKCKLAQLMQVSYIALNAFWYNFSWSGCKLWLWWIQTHARLSSQRKFPSTSTHPSEVGMFFFWNLSTITALGQVVNLDLLLCIGFIFEHANLLICSNALFLFYYDSLSDWHSSGSLHFYSSYGHHHLMQAFINLDHTMIMWFRSCCLVMHWMLHPRASYPRLLASCW